MRTAKPVQRGGSSKKIQNEASKIGFPPIKSDAAAGSRSASRGATPKGTGSNSQLDEPSTQLPSIRPPSAKNIDTKTRVQLHGRQHQPSEVLDQADRSFVESRPTEPSTEEEASPADVHPVDQGEAERIQSDALVDQEEQHESTGFSESDYGSEAFLMLSKNSQIELEDPELQYWRVHSAPPKNTPNVGKEALKRMQAAAASKKLDFSEMGLVSIPEKVSI